MLRQNESCKSIAVDNTDESFDNNGRPKWYLLTTLKEYYYYCQLKLKYTKESWLQNNSKQTTERH